MRKFIQNKLKEQKGLTLIELLAVIVILAIIAAIAIPAIGNIIENSRVGAIKSDATNVLAAADLYFTDGNTPTTPGTVTLAELKAGNYLDDAGSFENGGATAPTVTNGTGSAASTISGVAKAGNITLTFIAAPRKDINTLNNNLSNNTAITTIN